MNHSEGRPSEARRLHNEAVVAKHLQQLFRRLPTLSGFWLHPDLEVTDLLVFTWQGCTAGQDLYDEVTQCLLALAEEYPEAVQLIRGRTFARAVH